MANKKANRLIDEKSPYLQQHAFNPVNWYPWGEEAFERAKKENKPLFVSIGYSTCHWCHVMERESFEDEEVARILNERFVSIKVDREERPDIDSVYMLACQMMTGHGGWPLSVFLTPTKEPFYAGTYFPKESRYGIPGFKEVLLYLSEQYENNPNRIRQVGEEMKHALETFKEGGESPVTEKTVEKAYRHYRNSFDPEYGGFGKAPKFPMPHQLMFLFRYYKYTGEKEALNMAEKTLDALSRGGIYDHIGFGFSRYSVDKQFLVPHFEKMLYDNALLAMGYTEAFQLTKKNKYKEKAEEIFTYVLRDMRHGKGGFYSAEDADSEGEEGKFYLWTPAEVKEILGESMGELFCHVFDITDKGNFQGKNIPNLIAEDIDTYAKRRGMDAGKVKTDLQRARQRLFNKREERVRPFKDDKILTAWNGLMIASLAKAGRVFGNSHYVEVATEAVSFIERNLMIDGRLMVRYRDHEVKEKGFIDEYAFLLWGYGELFEATMDLEFVKRAKKLADRMIELFWDEKQGGFFFSGTDQTTLLVRLKESYDGALPSGNSVAIMQLLKLAKWTGDYTYEEKVEQTIRTFGKNINDDPAGHAFMFQTVLATLHPMKEVILLTEEKEGKGRVNEFIKRLQEGFYPEITLLFGKREELAEITPYIKDYNILNGKPTIYICEHFHCNEPTNDVNRAEELLKLQNSFG